MGKLIKLRLIVFVLSARHITHEFCLTRGALPKLAESMAFLSVLLFGAFVFTFHGFASHEPQPALDPALWIGDLGIRHGDRMLVNRAFTGFAIWLLTRYFDTFWKLLDRALCFTWSSR